MRFDDGATNAKSHAGTIRLGSKEGIEDVLCVLWVQPQAGIRDGYLYFLFFRSVGADDQLASPIRVFHRIDAIDHEVHEPLLQLHAIPHYRRSIHRELRAD